MSGALGAMTVAAAIAGLYGCTALTPDVGGLTEPGSVVNGFIMAKSTVALNRANEHLSRAQAQLAMQQAIDLEIKRRSLKEERVATTGILRDMAAAKHQPLFADLAQWVAAGGDPDYALKYALNHQNPAALSPTTTQVKSTPASRQDGSIEPETPAAF
jgi:hypothetical protein